MSLKRNKNSVSTYSWIWRGLLVLALTLLLTCFVTNKDPKSVLNDVYQYALGNKDKISKNDKQWSSFLAKKDLAIDSLRQIISTYKSQTTPDSAFVKTTSTGLNLRSLPSTVSDVIARIPDGTKVKLFYKDNETITVGEQTGSWVKISYNGVSGFVFSTYLDI